jgi:hypothetical protein
MTALGIALIVSGVALVCATVIFLLIVAREPPSALETFEQGLERHDHYGVRRAPQDLDADKSEPTEHVPEDGERRDQPTVSRLDQAEE